MGRMVDIELALDEGKSFWQMSADDFREGDTIEWERTRPNGSVERGTAVLGPLVRREKSDCLRGTRLLSPRTPDDGARFVVRW